MILLREKLARLLQKQRWAPYQTAYPNRGMLETWEEISEFRQSQYLERADEIIKLFVDSINKSPAL